jgi:DNA-binding transcriptional ArsR family regulator
MQQRPVARRDGILIERLGDEVVVYDSASHTAHALAGSAAVVWEACTGERTAEDLAGALGLEPAIVERALTELAECGLLDGEPARSAYVSRRDAMRRFAKIGGAAFAAPLIYSVAVGPATAAASTITCSEKSVNATGFGSSDAAAAAAAQTNANALCQKAPGCRSTSTCECTPEKLVTDVYSCAGPCNY